MWEVFVRHDSWEWGWDAWVAIGTLALAGVTVFASLLPMFSEARRRRERERQRKKEAMLFALSVVDELAAAHASLPGLRKLLRGLSEVAALQWNGDLLAQMLIRVDLPVLTKRIDRAVSLDDDDAKAVVLAFASVSRLRAGLDFSSFTVKALEAIPVGVIQSASDVAAYAQLAVDDAYSRMYRLGKPGKIAPVLPEAQLTDGETQRVGGLH